MALVALDVSELDLLDDSNDSFINETDMFQAVLYNLPYSSERLNVLQQGTNSLVKLLIMIAPREESNCHN